MENHLLGKMESLILSDSKSDETLANLKKYLQNSKAKSFTDPAFAACMDSIDPLKDLRDQFVIPKIKDVVSDEAAGTAGGKEDEDCIYFCGNSLGLMPKMSKVLIDQEVLTWSERGAKCWFSKKEGGVPWVEMEELTVDILASIVGANPTEVTVSTSLTVNLHTLLTAFYRPTQGRSKILLEANAFPSDHYAIESHIRWHGFETGTSMICMSPREGEYTLRTEDICEYIEKNGSEIALVMFPGIQYYTGQLFDMEKITAIGKAQGCTVGWDLAHAVGNVPLKLHDWNVDFAVWCTYKYLNSGPGGIGGLFVSDKIENLEKSINYNYRNRLSGWWAGDVQNRFQMKNVFVPRPGAAGFKQSTTSIFQVASLLGSLDVFSKTNMTAIRAKSLLLTGYLEHLISSDSICSKFVQIITPQDPNQRGAQLSLKVPHEHLNDLVKGLEDGGVVFDERRPDCIRIAPASLYNRFQDVLNFVLILREVIVSIS